MEGVSKTKFVDAGATWILGAFSLNLAKTTKWCG